MKSLSIHTDTDTSQLALVDGELSLNLDDIYQELGVLEKLENDIAELYTKHQLPYTRHFEHSDGQYQGGEGTGQMPTQSGYGQMPTQSGFEWPAR